MTPEHIAAKYADQRVGLTVRLLPPGEDGADPLLLIEGSGSALKMLSELSLALATDPLCDSLEITSDGLWSTQLSEEFGVVLVIHRT